MNDIAIKVEKTDKNIDNFKFLRNMIQLKINKGFASHAKPARPDNKFNHPNKKARNECAQDVVVQ